MSEEIDKLLEVLHGLKKDLDTFKETVQPLQQEISTLRAEERELDNKLMAIARARSEKQGDLFELELKIGQLPEKIKQTQIEIERLRQLELEKQRLDRARNELDSLTLEAKWRAENRNDGLGAKPHQIDGGYQLALNNGSYLFDKRGLGKSLTSLIMADFVDAKKVCIVTPNDVVSVFGKQVKLWTNRTVVLLSQMDAIEREMWLGILKRTNEFTVILNPESWWRTPELISRLAELQFDVVIADEAHLANKTELKTWQGLWNLIRGIPNQCPSCSSNKILAHKASKQVLCTICGENGQWYNDKFVESQFNWLSVKHPLLMTGTPILNRPQDLYPLLRINQPTKFYNEAEYVRNYCAHITGTRYTWRRGAEKEIFKIMGDRMVMRDRHTAGVEIPDQQIIVHELTLDPEQYPQQAAALKQIKDYAQLVMNDAGDTMNITAFITLLLRMRQGIVWPAGINLVRKELDEATGREVIISQQHLEVYESIKMDWVFEHIKEDVENGERILLFSQFKPPLYEMQKRLLNANISAAVYCGDTSKFEGERIKNDFDPQILGDKKPLYDVALIQYRKGGTGLNLQAATTTYILDEEWNPGKADQAYGRNDRMGQTRQTQVHIPRVMNSVGDAFMAQLLGEKGEMVGAFESSAKMIRDFRNAMDDKDML